MSVTINGTSGVTFNDASNQTTAATGFGFKNRIINGAMVIDQRNAGASVALAGGNFPVDRMRLSTSGSVATAIVQQNLNGITPPVGFQNYIGLSVSTGSATGSTSASRITQRIEGYNVADLGFGASGASSVTVSFWVRASITGTYGGSLQNSAANRVYVFSYTINAANTWEYKTVTITGDTSGTWLKDNGVGALLLFSVGSGSTLQGSAGSWGSTYYDTVTGQVDLLATTGATFYITGVQLEKGSTATSFDYRPYGTELALCQRYYYKWINDTAAAKYTLMLQAYSTTGAFGKLFDLPVTMRTQPTATASGTFTAINSTGGSTTAFSGKTIDALTAQSVSASGWTGSSGLVAGNATVVSISASAYIEVTAEL